MEVELLETGEIDTEREPEDRQVDVLAVLFGSKARATVVRFFMLDPRRAYYQRQVEVATGLPIRAVQRELERLSEIGLLYKRSEGNRAYYQVDVQYPLFSDLRHLVLKTSTPVQKLRGALAGDEDVRQAFLNEETGEVLAVTLSGRKPMCTVPEGYRVQAMSSEEFVQRLQRRDSEIGVFLSEGLDILGRRDDVIWGRIEAAGYVVRKGEGIP